MDTNKTIDRARETEMLGGCTEVEWYDFGYVCGGAKVTAQLCAEAIPGDPTTWAQLGQLLRGGGSTEVQILGPFSRPPRDRSGRNRCGLWQQLDVL